MANAAELERRRLQRLDDEARSAAAIKYGIPGNAIPDAATAAKVKSGAATWDSIFAGLAGVQPTFQATGTSGGPGGGATFTTAPGTVGSTVSGGGYSGGSSGGGSGVAAGRDPMATAALQRIEKVGTGENVPMNAAQTDRMMSSQSDMSAAAESQQQAALRRAVGAGGGSLYDPSTGAAERELTAERQSANQGARRDIDTNAQAQNFEAQFAANRLLAAQADGGINSGNPYGQNGRYGASQAQTQYSDTDPRRGGNIQGYAGYNLDPTKMNNTATDQYSAQQQALKQVRQSGSYLNTR